MSWPPGVVQRILVNAENGQFQTQYRTRLGDGIGWGWGEKDEAFIFESMERPAVSSLLDYEKSAEVHAAQLKAEGERHVHPVPWGARCAAERELRRKNRDAQMEASLPMEAIILEPKFETGKRPPIRRAKSAKKRFSPAVSPFEWMEKEYLA